MTSIFAIALKDLKLLVRDRYGLFWVLAFPLMTALFFGAIYNQGGKANKIKIAVVDDDQTATSGKLFERLKNSESVEVLRFVAESEKAKPEAITAARAEELVRKGRVTAFLHIKKGFDNGSGMFFDVSKLELGTDPSRSAERGLLEGVVMQNVFMGFTESFSDPKVGREQIAQAKKQLAGANDLSFTQSAVLGTLFNSLDALFAQQQAEAMEGKAAGGLNNSPFSNMKLAVRDVSMGNKVKALNGYEITFPQALVWAFMGSVTSFAVSSVHERTHGTLLRLKVAPLGNAQILLGKGLACLIAMMGISTFLLTVGRFVFQIRIEDPLKLALVLACAGIAFVGMMTFIATLGKTERSVAGSSTAICMIFAFLGGAAVPLMFMPAFMLTLSNFSPFKWLIMGVEGSIWRGYSFADLVLPCAALLGFGLLFYAAALFTSRYSQRA